MTIFEFPQTYWGLHHIHRQEENHQNVVFVKAMSIILISLTLHHDLVLNLSNE